MCRGLFAIKPRHLRKSGKRGPAAALAITTVGLMTVPVLARPAVGAAAATPSASGNLIVVSSAPGIVIGGSGGWTYSPDGCHLPDAIRAANTNSPVGGCTGGDPDGARDTIVLDQNAPLFAATPTITSAVDLLGNGHVIDGRDTYRLLDIAGADASVHVSNVVLQHGAVRGADGRDGTWDTSNGGSASGAAIRVADTARLSLDRVVIRDNVAAGGTGGVGATAQGSLAPNDRTNMLGHIGGTGGAGSGGALAADHAFVTIRRSVITGNKAVGGDGGAGGQGGAGYVGDNGECNDSWTAELSGGGATMKPQPGTDGGQGGFGGVGGPANGAAISVVAGSLTIDESSITGNTATAGTGGAGGAGGDAGTGGHLKCTLYIATPGGFGFFPAQIGMKAVPVHYDGDDGDAGPAGVPGHGGDAVSAIASVGASVTMTATTVAGNRATAGNGAGASSAGTIHVAGTASLGSDTIAGNHTTVWDGDDVRPPASGSPRFLAPRPLRSPAPSSATTT